MPSRIILAVDPEGTVTTFDVPENRDLLRTMYGIIDTDIVELVTLDDKLSMWLDEEGALRENPRVNVAATRFGRAYGTMQSFVGVAVFTGGADDDGDTLGLTAAQVEKLQRVLPPLLAATSVQRVNGLLNSVRS